MKTRFLKKGFFVIFFILLLFPLVTFGETSPFTVKVTPLKDRVPADDLIPVTVEITTNSPFPKTFFNRFKTLNLILISENGLNGLNFLTAAISD